MKRPAEYLQSLRSSILRKAARRGLSSSSSGTGAKSPAGDGIDDNAHDDRGMDLLPPPSSCRDGLNVVKAEIAVPIGYGRDGDLHFGGGIMAGNYADNAPSEAEAPLAQDLPRRKGLTAMYAEYKAAEKKLAKACFRAEDGVFDDALFNDLRESLPTFPGIDLCTTYKDLSVAL